MHLLLLSTMKHVHYLFTGGVSGLGSAPKPTSLHSPTDAVQLEALNNVVMASTPTGVQLILNWCLTE